MGGGDRRGINRTSRQADMGMFCKQIFRHRIILLFSRILHPSHDDISSETLFNLLLSWWLTSIRCYIVLWSFLKYVPGYNKSGKGRGPRFDSRSRSIFALYFSIGSQNCLPIFFKFGTNSSHCNSLDKYDYEKDPVIYLLRLWVGGLGSHKTTCFLIQIPL